MEITEILIFSSLVAIALLGGVLVNVLSKNGFNNIKILLAFSGGFLLAIAFLHLIPEIYHIHSEEIGIYILLGFLLQLVLEYFSKGIEHGHFHVNAKNIFPLGVFISLCIHSFVEGIPLERELHNISAHVGDHHHHDHSHGEHSLFFGILFHKLPVAIALMTLFIKAELTVWKRWTALAIFAIMAPLAGILTHYFGASILGDNANTTLDILLAIVIGMLLHVSTTIIFETSDSHKFNAVKLLAIISGVAVAFLAH